MENKKASTFIFSVIAIILGVTLFRQFDFENYKFEKPGLAVVYMIVFVISVYILIKDFRNNSRSKR
jgi:membrane protein DedA with SNARE-associated domain